MAKSKIISNIIKRTKPSEAQLRSKALGILQSPKKPKQQPLAQPKSEVDINPQPESARPTAYPEYKPKLAFNPDKSVSYSHGDKAFNLSPEEYKQYQAIQTGGKQGGGSSGVLSANVKAMMDYEAVQRAISGEAMKGVPSGISSQDQLNLYNEIKGKEQMSKEDVIREIAARESAKPVEPLQKAGSIQQQAGFVATGEIAGSGVAGLAASGGLGTAAAAAVLNPALLAGGAAIIAAKSLMAAQGKNRDQDILTAKGTSTNAMKFLNFYKTEALNPQADKEDLISDYYNMKRQVYAAQALLEERSTFDKTFRVNTGADELAKIKIWMANEDNLDRDFFNNLAYSDAATYNSQINMATQSLNAEEQK